MIALNRARHYGETRLQRVSRSCVLAYPRRVGGLALPLFVVACSGSGSSAGGTGGAGGSGGRATLGNSCTPDGNDRCTVDGKIAECDGSDHEWVLKAECPSPATCLDSTPEGDPREPFCGCPTLTRQCHDGTEGPVGDLSVCRPDGVSSLNCGAMSADCIDDACTCANGTSPSAEFSLGSCEYRCGTVGMVAHCNWSRSQICPPTYEECLHP